MAGEHWSSRDEINDYLTVRNRSTAGPILYEDRVDTSNEHIAVIGATNRGKTSCLSLPFAKTIIDSGESGVVIDVKGDFVRRLWPQIKEKYQQQAYLIDFCSAAQSPSGFNPLTLPYLLAISNEQPSKDLSQDLVHSLFSERLFSDENCNDVFWPHSAATLSQGLCEALFDVGEPQHIHIASLADMLCHLEDKATTFVPAGKMFGDMLSSSTAKQKLNAYLNAPNETRSSIFSVAATGLSPVNSTTGLQELLSRNDLNLSKLDLTQPFFIILRIPDYTTAPHIAAGMVISQLSQYLEYQADMCFHGKLPIRCSFILEELSTLGKAIDNLPQLAAQGRSRGLRLMLILQDKSQLYTVFSEKKAQSIMSCMGIHVLFSTMNHETLNEYSALLGSKLISENGRYVERPLCSPAQLGALRTGEALIIIKGKVSLKYVHHFRMYEEIFDDEVLPENDFIEEQRTSSKPVTFDLLSFVNEHLKEDSSRFFPKDEAVTFDLDEEDEEDQENELDEADKEQTNELYDIDALIASIDKKIHELQENEKNNQEKTAKYWVRINTEVYSLYPAIRIITSYNPSLSWTETERKLLNLRDHHHEAKFFFDTFGAAEACRKKLEEIRVDAIIGFGEFS